jgi:dihydroorotase-like cyclic amidohydrolase
VADQFDLVIRAARVITGAAEAACAIGVTRGRIAAIRPICDTATAPLTIELGDDTVLLPGLVDSHVHVCEPGQAGWEGFATATRAAAAGGITTLVDMPLDSIPVTVSAGALAAKQRAAEGRCHVDVGFWGGVIPQNLADLGALHDAGVLGFKCFLADSGLADFPPVDGRGLATALGVLRGLPLVWTQARRRGFSLSDVATWMSRRPAALAGLRRKGRIAVGYDADFAVFAPDESFTVDPARLHHRHPVTPYGGWRLRGVVRDTLLRGEPVDPARPRGRLLTSPG